MRTIDDEIAARSVDFLERKAKEDRPFFLWVNFTHMHFRTHVKPEDAGRSGRWQSEYHDAMIGHHANVGAILDSIDRLGLAGDTFVMYSTDDGPHANTWPDAATTPFRSEKNTNWEGAYRVPRLVRWPGRIAPGSVSNEIVSDLDWLPTFLDMAGDPDVVDEQRRGLDVGGAPRKVHLGGHDLLPHLTGAAEKGPRSSFIYCNDDQQVTALRHDNWKFVFLEQRAAGTLRIWAEPFTGLRVPKIFNLRTDPYERADVTSNTCYDWLLDRVFLLVPSQEYMARFAATFREFPPRQKAASFNVDEVMARMKEGPSGR